MCSNDADEMTNSVDPDQTAPVGAVWSGSALFAQICLPGNLGPLRYYDLDDTKSCLSGNVNRIAMVVEKKNLSGRLERLDSIFTILNW